MKKSYLVLAAVAALFAACSSDNNDAAERQNLAQNEPMAIGFDTYVNRGTTRAGSTGDINDLDALKSRNFGVFAYYTNSDTYDPIYAPNFMYNQRVIHDGSKWGYTPIKYWPNEYINANAEENDKISFFAYAPWVDCTPLTGKISGDKDFGIVGFTRNTAASDPMVKYNVSFDLAKQVDLLWGVCKTDNSWQAKSGNHGVAGMPWLNVEHPVAIGQPLTFDFNHALSRLIVTVDLYANAATATAAAAGTKVFIRSITFSGFSTTGTLNLNNAVANIPLWLSNDGLNDIESGIETTIKDGRKDGKEGLFAATNEKGLINPALTQTTVWGDTGEKPGVTATATNLFNTSAGSIQATDPIYVIPNGDKFNVTIVYDVMTADPRLPGYLNDGTTHGSVVTNTISKIVKIGSDDLILEPLKKYTVNLHIALDEVVVDATANDWTATSAGSAGLPDNDTVTTPTPAP